MGIKTNRIEQIGTSSGLILPRVTTAEMMLLPSDEGALCYNTDENSTYQYQSSIWVQLTNSLSTIDGGSAIT